MGRDNVLVVRQKDGSHQGASSTPARTVATRCAAPRRATPRPSCAPTTAGPYDLAGNLIGVPGPRPVPQGRARHAPSTASREVAQLDTYKGFVFATMDPTAPPLHEYLGPTGRLGIDLMALRGDIEVDPRRPEVRHPLQLEVRGRQPLRLVPPADHPHVRAFASGMLPGRPRDGNLDRQRQAPRTRPTARSSTSRRPAASVGSMRSCSASTATRSVARPGRLEPTRSGRSTTLVARAPEAIEALGPVGLIGRRPPEHLPEQLDRDQRRSSRCACRVSPNQTEIWWFTLRRQDCRPERQAMAIVHGEPRLRPGGLARARGRRELGAEHDADEGLREPARSRSS